MATKQITSFEKLTYAAHGYFILVSLTWLVISWLMNGHVNYSALLAVVIFSTEIYFMHKLANLLTGILTLGLSLFFLLEFITMGAGGGYNVFVSIMIVLCVLSLVASGILIFSFMKLGFKGQ